MSNLKILNDIGTGCGDEVLRNLKIMANEIVWQPGYSKEKPVRVQYNIPVVFSLE